MAYPRRSTLVDEVLADLMAFEEGDEDWDEGWENGLDAWEEGLESGFFRRLARAARNLARRARQRVMPGLLAWWLRLRQPDPRRIRGPGEPRPVRAPAPPRPPLPALPPPPRRRASPPPAPPGGWNGSPPQPPWSALLDWARRRRGGNGVEEAALLEHLAHAAAEAASEAEAEAYVGAMVPLAARLHPAAGGALRRAAPALIRTLAVAAQALRRDPRTRLLLRTLPTALHRTAARIGRQARRGRAVPPPAAARLLGRETLDLLARPARCRRALADAARLDELYHRRRR